MRPTPFRCLLCVALVCLPVAARADEKKSTPVLAVFTISGVLSETPMGDSLSLGGSGMESLKGLLARMNKVCDDDSVAGVVLLLGDASLGTAQIEEIRSVMDKIKSSGKQIHVHADSFSTRDYVLLSGASQIGVVPTGDIWITGVSAESPYVRGLLDMIGVTPDYFTCGDYKSAGEMFMRKGPSEEAQENLNWLLDGIYESYLRLIARGRGVEVDQARKWIDRGLYSAAEAKAAGIIDQVQYRQDFVASLKQQYGENLEFDKRYGKKKPLSVDLSSPYGLLKFYVDLIAGATKPRKSEKDAVAIVYVEGPILPGSGSPGGFPFVAAGGIAYSTPIRKALDKAADDDSVKAVVLRVNSPGGSAVASEIILNATKRVAQKKPFVVSMGDVAGSGGYYVSCGSETIFADETTVTGSIGVVVGKLATDGMWKKIGVHWKPTRRGKNAGILTSGEVFTDAQRKQLQEWMDEIYEQFKGHVTAIRGPRLKKDIDQLAGGRVYTGTQALELGLVDKLGGLDDAIQHVAQQAGLKQYEVRVMPKPKDFLELLLSDLVEPDKDEKTLSLPGAGRPAGSLSLLHAALPLLEGLEPHRAQAVRRALKQLSLLRHERVLLTMPVIEIAP